jgi:NTE family protein
LGRIHAMKCWPWSTSAVPAQGCAASWVRGAVIGAWWAAAGLAALAQATPAEPAASPPASTQGGTPPAALRPPLGRPRIGLVLSGGGARGLAHVGVLKVLESARVPVDVIAGTSMGAIIGGLYASGMSADELERELLSLDWDKVFASRVARESLSLRRKEEDFEISPAIEIGLNPVDGQPMLPLGSVSSRGLELLLRRYTLPVRAVRDFDALPIPFRAVATDMETGAGVVFRDGDLAEALRASMSVPGVFPPSDVGGRILGDGGLVNNLPVDVVRALGADIVIAVNVGTPLARRDTLGTVLGLTAQMINILTEQNVQRSLASLDAARDVLIAPDLARLSSGDFARSRELMALGSLQAASQQARLAELALAPAAWRAWLAQRDERAAPVVASIVSVRFEGTAATHPERRQALLESQPGRPFDVAAAERDSRQLAASGDYLHADYRVEDLPAGTGLVFSLEEKPWGPNYFRMGLELSSDFNGRGSYNVKLSHNRHWLNEWGGEWRNLLQLGATPRLHSEWYQPLGIDRGSGSDWFLGDGLQRSRAPPERERRQCDRPLRPRHPDAAHRCRPTLGRLWRIARRVPAGVAADRARFRADELGGLDCPGGHDRARARPAREHRGRSAG